MHRDSWLYWRTFPGGDRWSILAVRPDWSRDQHWARIEKVSGQYMLYIRGSYYGPPGKLTRWSCPFDAMAHAERWFEEHGYGPPKAVDVAA